MLNMEKCALLIYRAPEFSPNNVQKDAAILNAVGVRLKSAQGMRVETCTEDDLPKELESYDVIFSMGRRLATIIRLENLQHTIVLNSPHGVRNVARSRELTLMLLESDGVNVPEWWAYDPEEDEMFMTNPSLQRLLPGWVKVMRADGVNADDVTYVTSAMEADCRIIELAAQQVPDIVVQKHLEGDLLKCYCVMKADEPFICWFYPQETGYSKFGGAAEAHNSPLAYTPVLREQLLQLAEKLSRRLGLVIFGFDAIVQPSDSPAQPSAIYIIDVNDWPSFSRCSEEAADAIVKLLN